MSAVEEMNVLSVFETSGWKIRTVVQNDEILYCAKDICKSLCLSRNAHKEKLKALDHDEIQEARSSGPLGGTQITKFVTEAGLYKMILWSKGAKTAGHPAHKFVRWITHEVLPQIRKNGVYQLTKELLETKNELALASNNNTFLRNNRLFYIAWSIMTNNPRNYYAVKRLMSNRQHMLRWFESTPYVKPQYVQTVRTLIQNLP